MVMIENDPCEIKKKPLWPVDVALHVKDWVLFLEHL